MILGKNNNFLGKKSAIFSKIGKVYLLNWDFPANWECSRSIRNFFSQLAKNLVPETGPSFVLIKDKTPQKNIPSHPTFIECNWSVLGFTHFLLFYPKHRLWVLLGGGGRS